MRAYNPSTGKYATGYSGSVYCPKRDGATVTFYKTFDDRGNHPHPTSENCSFDDWGHAFDSRYLIIMECQSKGVGSSNHGIYNSYRCSCKCKYRDGQASTATKYTRATKTVKYGEPYVSLPTLENGSWYTASSGGSAVTGSTTVTTAGNHTIYAH